MFEVPDKFVYLILTIPFLLVWLFIFYKRKDLRKELLTISAITALIGPLSEIIYFRDYWLPESVLAIYIGNFPFMIEDVLFGFAIGGIGAVIYEFLFHKNLIKCSDCKKPNMFFIVILFILSLLILLLLGLNSIIASSVAFIITGVYVLFNRKDLLFNSIFSGILTSLTVFIIYLILFKLIFSNPIELFEKGWYLYKTNLGILFLGIPLTELIWAFCWGFLAGPLYEFINNKKN